MIVLYHGTSERYAKKIIEEGIDVNINTRRGDFGKGFYLTTSFDAAKEWAIRKDLYNPCVIEVLLQDKVSDNVRFLDLGKITPMSSFEDIVRWARFVVATRNGDIYCDALGIKEQDANHNKYYDIVVGQIADGDIIKIANKCLEEKRFPSDDEVKNLVEKNYGLQYCICTEAGKAMLSKLPRIKKGVWQ